MRKIDPRFGHADFLRCGVGGCGQGQHAVVCETNVLGCDDHESPGDVEGVFARLQHACEVVEGGVGVGAADGFVEGGDRVVVLVAGAVVDEGFGEGGFDGGFGCVGALGQILSNLVSLEWVWKRLGDLPWRAPRDSERYGHHRLRMRQGRQSALSLRETTERSRVLPLPRHVGESK